jgi:hypothetical protein
MLTADLATPKLKQQDAEKAIAEPSSNPFSLDRYSPGVRKIASFGLSLFLIGLLITMFWSLHYWVISVLCSSACMALGWLTGFLFGVPRVGASDAASADINTNLEQISDWLTKILVGVGLTQLGKLPHALAGVANHISKEYGKYGNDVFSASMVLYFSTLGFLTGYLLTRLVLQEEFNKQAGNKIEVKAQGSAEVTVIKPAPTDTGTTGTGTTGTGTTDTGTTDTGTTDTGTTGTGTTGTGTTGTGTER